MTADNRSSHAPHVVVVYYEVFASAGCSAVRVTAGDGRPSAGHAVFLAAADVSVVFADGNGPLLAPTVSGSIHRAGRQVQSSVVACPLGSCRWMDRCHRGSGGRGRLGRYPSSRRRGKGG